jgi:hypothetical protein
VQGVAYHVDSGGLALEVADPRDPLAAEHFEAAHVDARQEHDWIALIDPDDVRRDEVQAHVRLARGQTDGDRPATHVLEMRDLGEALGPQQLVGDVLRGPAEARGLEQPQARRLRRRLGRGTGRAGTDQGGRRAGHGGCSHKFTTTDHGAAAVPCVLLIR